VAGADAILTVPLNPAYSSLNLGQAVMLVAYEWYQSGDLAGPSDPAVGTSPAASKAQLQELFHHLEDELEANRFLQLPHMRPVMVRNLRNLLSRARLTAQEVKTLHGVVTALAGRKWQPRGTARGEQADGEPAE
jgi:tRNA/rRNA methyltransferase